MKKIVFLTTVNHNVGDEFIREGIVYFLKAILGEFESILIHKHEPVRPTPSMMNFKGGRRLWRILHDVHTERYFNQIMDADVIVQAGAPVYWNDGRHDSSKAEWVKPFWYDRVAKIYHEKPVMNIAAGACLAYHEGPEKILENPTLCDFIRRIHGYCSVTTVRDTLASDVLTALELPHELLPCASIFAKDSLSVTAALPEFFVINYMQLGGHYKFEQGYDPQQWAHTLMAVYHLAKKDFPVKWVCHNQKEVMDVKKLGVADTDIFYATGYKDYIKMYASAACGLLNRVHGAMMMASFGRKSMVVGSDSRVKMADMIGIPTAFIGDMGKFSPEQILNNIMQGQKDFESHMVDVMDQARPKYMQIIQQGLEHIYEETHSIS